MWSILQNRDTPPLLVTAKFAIHKLCVDMCTWLSCFRIHFSSKVTVSPTLIRVIGSHWLDYNSLSMSAWSVHSLACCRIPCFFVLLVGIFVVPSLMNGMKVMPVFPVGCFFIWSSFNMWASAIDTISWRHLPIYLPWPRTTLHEDSMCYRVLLFHKDRSLGCLWDTFGRYLLVKVHNCVL